MFNEKSCHKYKCNHKVISCGGGHRTDMLLSEALLTSPAVSKIRNFSLPPRSVSKATSYMSSTVGNLSCSKRNSL